MDNIIVKNVDVMGDTIMAAKDKDGNIWVGVRWVCEALEMTEGQMKRQIKNIKKDMVFSQGGSNQLPLPTKSGTQEVFCIRNDFIPLWLAKMNITEKTREERPDFADKLLEYQLKAKDILAAAFLPRENTLTVLDKQVSLTDHPGKVANLIRVLASRMDKQGSAPYKTAEMAQMICTQYGIQLPHDFVKIPEYEQMKLSDFKKER